MTSLSSDRLFGVSAGLAVKAPARVATTGDIALTGLQVVDTEQLVAGDRVLAKHQAAASENGVYVADSGPWRRAADFDGPRDVVAGTRIYVAAGNSNGAREFVLTTSGPIVIGTTDLSFEAAAALSAAANVITATRAAATAGQTVFDLSYTINGVLVAVNGVIVDRADYVATDGVSVVFLQGLNLGDVVTAYSINGGLTTPTAAFAARLSANAANVTGAGSSYEIVFDASDFDDGEDDFDPATGRFTAPKPGRYQLNAQATFDGFTAAADEAELTLATTARSFRARVNRTNELASERTLTISVLADMAAGDTASVLARASGEASDNVDLVGGVDGLTCFSGYLIK